MDRETAGCVTSIGMVVLLLGGIFTYKMLAPQSAMRSKLGGEAIKLERPENCKRVINMGKSEDTKYIVYETHRGDVVMKEFSDWGLFEGEYIVPGGAIEVTYKTGGTVDGRPIKTVIEHAMDRDQDRDQDRDFRN